MSFLGPFNQTNPGCYCLTLKDSCRQKVINIIWYKGKNLTSTKTKFSSNLISENTIDSNILCY